MATLFYLSSTEVAAISPAPNALWEQTGQIVRRRMSTRKDGSALTDFSVTVPITTTQDIIVVQGISDPIAAQNIVGPASLIFRVSEDALSTNCTLNMGLRVLSGDGTTVRSPVAFAVAATGTEFTLTGAPATRAHIDRTISTVTALAGDRIVVEAGVRATGPTAAGSAILRFGSSAATDFAKTAGLTTDLNPWFELADNITFAAALPPLPLMNLSMLQNL